MESRTNEGGSMTYEFLKNIHQELKQVQTIANRAVHHLIVDKFHTGSECIEIALMLDRVLGMIEREYENVNKEEISI